MALNTWWTSEPGQRYWMEITVREDIGANLQALRREHGHWSYDLVGEVRTGDRVLHWSGPERALVGWSEVTGPAVVVPTHTWRPRGTYGRRQDGPTTSSGWEAPLGGFTRFRNGPTSARLLPLLDRIMAVNAELEARHGKPMYFPFYRYGGNRIRTQQAYLVKFPVELFDLIPDIGEARLDPEQYGDDGELLEDTQPSGKRAPRGRATRASDPKLRTAIERRALDVALAYYKGIGGTDARELGKPYDIAVTVDGVERHCEVKGSSMKIDTVELTVNEVHHGRDYPAVDLIVVDGIGIERDATTGDVTASGGDLRVWADWSPARDALTATRFAYRLPDL